MNNRIGAHNGSISFYEDEKPKRKAAPKPKVECANSPAMFQCMKWELQDKLDALIKATKQPGSEGVYQQLRILKSHINDIMTRFGPEVSDKDLVLARRIYERNK